MPKVTGIDKCVYFFLYYKSPLSQKLIDFLSEGILRELCPSWQLDEFKIINFVPSHKVLIVGMQQEMESFSFKLTIFTFVLKVFFTSALIEEKHQEKTFVFSSRLYNADVPKFAKKIVTVNVFSFVWETHFIQKHELPICQLVQNQQIVTWRKRKEKISFEINIWVVAPCLRILMNWLKKY